MRQATPSLGLLALFPLFTVSHWISRSCLFWSLSDLKLRTAIQHLFPPRRRTVLYLILFSHCFYLRPALAPGDCLFSYPITAPRRILENVVQYEIWLLIGFQEVSARYHSVLTEGDTDGGNRKTRSFIYDFFFFYSRYRIWHSLFPSILISVRKNSFKAMNGGEMEETLTVHCMCEEKRKT